jgi:hypothetical protein
MRKNPEVGTETSIGGLFIPLTSGDLSSHSVEKMGGRRNMAKTSLTPDQKRIAAAFGMSPLAFADKSARAMAAAHEKKTGKSRWGLSETQKAICRSTGMSEHAFAIASGLVKGSSPGLLRAHQEIDRAHDTLYDSESGPVDPPDRQLLDLAMTELTAYDPDDDDTYDSLLKGVLYLATLLDRAAPPFADNKEIKG